MKILVLCDQGNNRSVTIAHHLKYWGHDVLSAGLLTNEPETLALLSVWADRIIVTEQLHYDLIKQSPMAATEIMNKVQLWDVGPDTYPRPFNRKLLAKVRKLMQEHKAEYKLT
jgi:hypothetical protein